MANNKELIGKIIEKKPDQVRNKKSSHYGTNFWRLAVEIENEEIKEILVFECWLENKEKWLTMEQLEMKDFLDKKYLFEVQRKPGAGQVYRLINWELLQDYGSN